MTKYEDMSKKQLIISIRKKNETLRENRFRIMKLSGYNRLLTNKVKKIIKQLTSVTEHYEATKTFSDRRKKKGGQE